MGNDPLEFHRACGCTGWYGVLKAQADVDHLTTASVMSCAVAISALQSWQTRHFSLLYEDGIVFMVAAGV